MTLVDAITSCKAMRLTHQPVLSWLVVSWGTLNSHAECRYIQRERAWNSSMEALDRLADFYTNGRSTRSTN